MNLNTIEICGQSFDRQSDYFSFEWPFSEINEMSELAKLSEFPNLKTVSLDSTNLNDYGLKFVCQCPLIDNLNLQDTKITKIGIAYLVRLKKLAHLRLKENWQLDNSCVIHLNTLDNLVDLQIHETSIDKDGIANLNLPNLRNLLVGEADRGILLALSKRLPECEILVKGKAEYLNGEVIWERGN